MPYPLLEAQLGPERQLRVPQYRAAYAEYLRQRHDRSHCLAWTKVAVQRATGCMMPTPAERLPRIAEVRRQIDALPAPERHWYLLSLANDWSISGREALATEAELIAAAQALGPDAILRVLRGVGPADSAPAGTEIDPDLTAKRHGVFAWEPLARFLLRHGGKLIPPERCGEWVEIGRLHVEHLSGSLGMGHYGITSADWFLTAAQLQPERANEHIETGLATIPRDLGVYQIERGRLELAEFARRDDGLLRAVEWFYGDWPQQSFVEALAVPEHARLLWALVADERFDGLPWGMVPEFARAANAHAIGAVPFSDDTLRDLWHPLGVRFGDFHRQGAEAPKLVGLGVSVAAAEAQHPEATARLGRQIAAMRDRLRELAAAARPR